MTVDLELIHIQIEGATIHRSTILSKSLCAIRQFSWATASTSRGCFHCIANRGYCGILRNIAEYCDHGFTWRGFLVNLCQPSEQSERSCWPVTPTVPRQKNNWKTNKPETMHLMMSAHVGAQKKQNKPAVPDLVINGTVQNYAKLKSLHVQNFCRR